MIRTTRPNRHHRHDRDAEGRFPRHRNARRPISTISERKSLYHYGGFGGDGCTFLDQIA
jgi:hypothetical protein